MGDTAKKAGNMASTTFTGGALSTNGKGWAQGGSIKDVANNFTGGMIPGLNGSDAVDIPVATDKAQWNLTTPDGKLRSDLMLGSTMPGAFNQSQDVLNKLIGNATAEGPTKSASYLMDNNNRQLQNNLGNADAQTASGVSTATNNLAMRGGVDSGARERIGRAATTDNMMNQAKLMNDASGANLNILSSDEQNKQQSLQALPASLLAQAGMEQGNKQFDIGNTLSTVGNKYNTDMQAWGANQAAREQAQLAAKDKGALGLGFMGL